jgi:hypothetical protein
MVTAATGAVICGLINMGSQPGTVACFATLPRTGRRNALGLPVSRFDARAVHAVLGAHWRLVADSHEAHTTPIGTIQSFTRTASRRNS